MTARTEPTPGRAPLSREIVLRAAIALADEDGIGAVTMRRLAQRLGVEAMTLYYHVANKREMLSGMVDLVVSEFALADPDEEWKAALRASAISAHETLLRHRWAASLMLSPATSSPARMRHMEATLRTFRRAGFSAEMTDRGYHAVESHISGFTLWQVGMNLDRATLRELATGFLESLSEDEFPYVVEHIHQHLAPSSPSSQSAFVFGLDLILDGLERIRDAA